MSDSGMHLPTDMSDFFDWNQYYGHECPEGAGGFSDDVETGTSGLLDYYAEALHETHYQAALSVQPSQFLGTAERSFQEPSHFFGLSVTDSSHRLHNYHDTLTIASTNWSMGIDGAIPVQCQIRDTSSPPGPRDVDHPKSSGREQELMRKANNHSEASATSSSQKPGAVEFQFISGSRTIGEPPVKVSKKKLPGTYACSLPRCSYKGTFQRKSDLDRHVQTQHTVKFKRFPCFATGCKRRGENGFPREDKLKAHLLQGHKGDELYDCPSVSCRGTEMSLESLWLHVHGDHSYREYFDTKTIPEASCPLATCRKNFATRYKAREHLVKDHSVSDRFDSRAALKAVAFDYRSADDCCPVCVEHVDEMPRHLFNEHFDFDVDHFHGWVQHIVSTSPALEYDKPTFWLDHFLYPWTTLTRPDAPQYFYCKHCGTELAARDAASHHLEMVRLHPALLDSLGTLFAVVLVLKSWRDTRAISIEPKCSSDNWPTWKQVLAP